MRKNIVINSLFLAFSLILSACGGAAATLDPAQIAGTVAAQVDAQVSTKVAAALAAIQTQQQAQPTNTPLIPTVGSLPTIAPLNQPTAALPGVATTIPCNPPPLAIYENLPDGYQLYKNTPFTKTWTIQNAGTCTWNANYKIKFVSGDQMSGPAAQSFNATTRPGENLIINLALKTTDSVGTSTGYWGLYDDKDVYFGRVWVTISRVAVAPTLNSFAVTTVSVTNTGCNFSAAITSNGAGTVTYTWSASPDGITYTDVVTANQVFNGAETRTPTNALPSGTTHAKIFIRPNNSEWAAATPLSSPCP